MTLDLSTGGGSSSAVLDNALNGFRPTLSTGVPVTTADVIGATTIYYTPYKGNQISLYDGSNWNAIESAEFSLALGTLTAAKPYDIFCYDNAGVATLEFLAWTDDTNRATAVAYQDGVKVKSGDATRRYVGVFYTTSTTTTESSEANRYLQSEDNQVALKLHIADATASWEYTSTTVRQFNGSATNQVNFIIGSTETLVAAQLHSIRRNSGAGVTTVSGIGIDSTSAYANSGAARSDFTSTGAAYFTPSEAWYVEYTGIGKHFLSMLESSAAVGTTTWFGPNSPLTGIMMG